MAQLVEHMSNTSDTLGSVPSTVQTRTWKVKAGGLENQGHPQLSKINCSPCQQEGGV